MVGTCSNNFFFICTDFIVMFKHVIIYKLLSSCIVIFEVVVLYIIKCWDILGLDMYQSECLYNMRNVFWNALTLATSIFYCLGLGEEHSAVRN